MLYFSENAVHLGGRDKNYNKEADWMRAMTALLWLVSMVEIISELINYSNVTVMKLSLDQYLQPC